jgi:hypothetical protein
MAVMHPSDAAFEAEGDKKTDRDGEEVNEKIAPSMDGLVGIMHVDHRRYLVDLHLHLA